MLDGSCFSGMDYPDLMSVYEVFGVRASQSYHQSVNTCLALFYMLFEGL